MIKPINIKRLPALLLLLAFFMPLSQCSSTNPYSPNDPPTVTTKYAYPTDSKISVNHVLSFIAFFWPVFIIALSVRIKSLNASLLFKVIEIAGCLGTVYMLLILNIVGVLLYGSYVAFSAICIYGLITFYEIAVIIRVKINKKSVT